MSTLPFAIALKKTEQSARLNQSSPRETDQML